MRDTEYSIDRNVN